LKKIITAVILVTLILAAFTTVLSAPRVRAQGQTSEAKVLSYSWYISPPNTVLALEAGDIVAVGEVQNVGSNVIASVTLSGIAYNSTGQIQNTADFPAFGTNLLPGQISPFYLDFAPFTSVTKDDTYVSNVTSVTVSVAVISNTNKTQYSGLATSDVTSSNSSGTFTVSGNVQNTGDETIGNVWLLSTFYNATGWVLGVNETSYLDPSGSLAPGDSVQFVATPVDDPAELINGEIANYSLLIQSAPFVPSSTPTLPPSGTPPPSTSPTASPSKSSAPVSSGLIYEIAVPVVVVVVVLVALLLLRMRHKNAQLKLPPPPPPPPAP
jgi:hypothetical protein